MRISLATKQQNHFPQWPWLPGYPHRLAGGQGNYCWEVVIVIVHPQDIGFLFLGYIWSLSPGIMSCILLAPKYLGFRWLRRGKECILTFLSSVLSNAVSNLNLISKSFLIPLHVTQRRAELSGLGQEEVQRSALLYPLHSLGVLLRYLWASWNLV